MTHAAETRPARIALRWRILALLFIARAGLGVQFQTVGSAGREIADAFAFDNAQLGLMIGLFMAPGLFLALPAGAFARFASDRALSAAGLAALAGGGLLSAFAAGPETLGLGRILAGAGFLVVTLYFTKMVADWFGGREIATAMSLLVMSWPFGIAIGQIGHTWLVTLFDWRLPFLVASAWCALAAIGVWAIYRPPHDLPRFTGRSMRLLPREWALICCAGLAWGLFNAGYISWLSFGPAVLEAQGATMLAAASVISVASWVMIVSGAACGQIVDRFGRRDLVLTLGMLAGMASFLLLPVPGAGLGASLLFGIIGMAPAGVIMALSGQAVAPERRAFGMGVFFTLYHAVMAVAPTIAGGLVDRTGTPDSAMALGAGTFAIVILLVFAFRVLKSRPLAAAPQGA
ncbi:Predicted arabinose efflux permease, MFS family [Roseivivax lentus]|uniref:Predicted arabinose efflux permease, MFS family n=1 Tax=Roseivivax lentus TaxID=633194 RepID=A0A1N7PUQ5_9RHOB|nr:MFS transporter [Roseivivax lentus]SIT14280.1 Predicted arabinose efflux permease, MFS family [Roseivivax lentus]